MSDRRRAILLIVAGLALVASGLASWATDLDSRLHPLLRLAAVATRPGGLVTLSALGGFAVMGPIALIVVAALAAMRRRRDALWLFATIASGRLLIEGIKLLVDRPRPPLADRLESVGGWSFPSSHSAGSMMTALGIAIIVGGRPALLAALAVTATIGWTRLALAVHWPGDVLAGWGFAMAWVGAALWVRERIVRH